MFSPRALLVLIFFAASTAHAQDSGHEAIAEIAAFKDAIAETLEPVFASYAPWLLTPMLGSEIWRFVAIFITILSFVVLRRVVVWVTLNVLRRVTRRTPTDVDDQLVEAVNPPLGWFVIATGVYLGLFWPNLSPATDHLLDSLYRIAVIALVGWGMLRAIHILTGILSRLASATDSDLDLYLVPLVGRVLRVAVIGLIGVFALQEFGFNVAGILAGLGVGGLAFALAAQDTVANWFGALMIYTDRPFHTGDWIKTPQLEGVVEEIGLRSTRVRTFSKTLVSIPNSKIASGTIENYSRMPRRRVSFKMGITYATTPAMMRATLRGFEDVLREHPGVDQTFWLVKFDEFGDSSLNIMIYYFTSTTDWNLHLSVREDVNLQLMDVMAKIGVSPAFPSRSLYVEQVVEEDLARLDQQARDMLAARAVTADSHQRHEAPAEAEDG